MSETWEEAILRIVRAENGAISLQDIYREIEHHPLITPHHKELWDHQPRYHHWVRSALVKLKDRGDVQHVGRGLYISN